MKVTNRRGFVESKSLFFSDKMGILGQYLADLNALDEADSYLLRNLILNLPHYIVSEVSIDPLSAFEPPYRDNRHIWKHTLG
jgi:hypothetical protein